MAIPSTFPSENLLMSSLSGQGLQRAQENALLMRQQQQAMGATETDYIARAAQGLLAVGEPGDAGEADRAAAYPGVVQLLQRNGLARNAPPQYPGYKALQGYASLGLTAPQQYQMGLVPPSPALADMIKGVFGSAGQSKSYAGGIAGMESGGNSGAENPLWPVARGGPAGPHGFIASTWKDFAAANPGLFKGMSPQQVLAARTDPAISEMATNWYARENAKPLQAAGIQPTPANLGVAHALGGDGATKVLAAPDNTPLAQLIPETIPQNPQYGRMTVGDLKRKYAGLGPVGGGGGQQQAAAAPVEAADGQTASAPYQVAGAVVAPPGGAPAPAMQPGAGPPGPPPVQMQQAPPPVGTGTNSPQFQKALELQRKAAAIEAMPGAKTNAQAQAAVQYLKSQAALYMQADSVSVDPTTGIQTKALSGEQLNAANPNAHYVWDSQAGAYVDTTGTHPPVTPPSPRMTVTPGGDVIQSRPGGGASVVYATDPQRLAAQEAAKAEGASSGKATAEALPKIIDQSRAAQAAEGNIDYGLSQLDRARAGGINTGYFSGALASAAAAAKSIGIPPQVVGIDPSAIGNIQTARKTLAVVSGAILQQIIGKSDITDAKIDAFIHAQPGIETDPDAVRRVLAWARSQFTYEREMGQAAVKEAATNNGRLPTNWQARYFDQHGFAPIYNPSTGEMQQPDGSAPGRTSPVSPASRPPLSSFAR